MKVIELNEKELEMVKKEMLVDYKINDITLEEYCESHVRRCPDCDNIFFVDYNDTETKMCPKCYIEYLENEKEDEMFEEMDQYDIYIDNILMKDKLGEI